MKETWEIWTGGDRDHFQRIARKLLRQTFLVRDRDEESRRNYFFLIRWLDTFQEYFGYIGFEIALDRENGVAMLRSTISLGEGSRLQTGHLNLKKGESMVLCCLWTLYAERVMSGSLKQFISITLTDLRMEMDKYGFRDQIDKSMLTAILSLFQRYQLIDLRGRIGEEDFRITLYPSLQFAMEPAVFVRFAQAAAKRMAEDRTEAGDEGEEAEETDEADE